MHIAIVLCTGSEAILEASALSIHVYCDFVYIFAFHVYRFPRIATQEIPSKIILKILELSG